MRILVVLLAFAAAVVGFNGQATAGDWWDPMMKSASYSEGRPARAERSARSQRSSQSSRRASREDRGEERTRAPRAERTARASRSYSGGGGESGIASYYWQPQRTASGGWFNPNAMTAAHKTLPLGTRVRVTRSDTGQSVDVTINDRGPYVAGRVIDLSRAAAQAVNMTGRGLAPVQVSVLGR